VDYALVTIGGGFSIINTSNPSSPTEELHINHPDYTIPRTTETIGCS